MLWAQDPSFDNTISFVEASVRDWQVQNDRSFAMVIIDKASKHENNTGTFALTLAPSAVAIFPVLPKILDILAKQH